MEGALMALEDERTPLLEQDGIRRASAGSLASSKDGYTEIVLDFDGENDPENPLNWPKLYKRGVVGLLALMAFTVTFTCISVVPVANRITRDLNGDGHTDKTASVLIVTIWELGESAGPLFIGPLSEYFGRYRVYNGANLLFIAATLLAVFSQETYLFIAARCLTGAAVASNVLNPAIVGDIYEPEERGSAMSLIVLAPLTGGAIGPAIAGAIAENLGWRAVLWMSVILASTTEVALLMLFRETYSAKILRGKAAKLRLETGNPLIRTVHDVSEGKTDTDHASWKQVFRPFSVFFGSTVLQALSLYGGVTFTYFYIISTTLPDILEQIYGLSPGLTGLSFVTFSAGSILCGLLLNVALDRLYAIMKAANNGKGRPEYRLPFTIVGAFLLPACAISYGWCADQKWRLPAMLFIVGFMGFIMMLSYLPVASYAVDALGIYSASGITAMIVLRCLMGTFLPLSIEPMVKRFGYGWGFTVLAGVCLALSPIPLLIFRYGGQWRQRSQYTRET